MRYCLPLKSRLCNDHLFAMKVIIVHGRHGASRSISLSPLGRTLLSVCLLGIPALLGGIAGYYIAAGDTGMINQQAAQSWRESLEDQQHSVEETKKNATEQLQALTVKVAELQARLVRLDAVGERLVQMGGLSKGEFDFSQPPAMGGPEVGAMPFQAQPLDFVKEIDLLSARIDNRWAQLDTLQGVMNRGSSESAAFVSGLPVHSGWMSSSFGYRPDPFTGQTAWHNGVDFPGEVGSDILAVAAGVVTWADNREGYGLLVEVNHGNGYLTRYAHNSASKVKVGDIVKKGQILALMGNSGRSTGPHVHFEVYKDGRAVDPSSYIQRTYR